MEDEIKKEMPKDMFCRLCGKYKPSAEFLNIKLGQVGNLIIEAEGCHSCDTVIHNAITMIQEAVVKFKEHQSKIIKPTLIPPRNLKGGPIGRG